MHERFWCELLWYFVPPFPALGRGEWYIQKVDFWSGVRLIFPHSCLLSLSLLSTAALGHWKATDPSTCVLAHHMLHCTEHTHTHTHTFTHTRAVAIRWQGRIEKLCRKQGFAYMDWVTWQRWSIKEKKTGKKDIGEGWQEGWGEACGAKWCLPERK